jgi:hypothetical protein
MGACRVGEYYAETVSSGDFIVSALELVRENSKRSCGSALRHWLSKNISRKGPRNCRSLGFARDDKKGRVDARRERLLKGRAVAKGESGWQK